MSDESKDPVVRALKSLVRVMEGREARDYMGKIDPEKAKKSPNLKISMGKISPSIGSDSGGEPPDAIKSILAEVCTKESTHV